MPMNETVDVKIPKEGTSENPFADMHPEYVKEQSYWYKYRLTYEGGDEFVEKYLCKFSNRESDEDFKDRKLITYNPDFGSAAVNDIKNAIFQRMVEVERVGGPTSYANAARGKLKGVDLEYSTMGQFIGTEILPELLPMRKVGVLVDNYSNLGVTQADKGTKHPYLSVYQAEDILNWAPRRPVNGFDILLLRETVDSYNTFGLPDGTETQYRLYKRTPEGVHVTIYDENQEVKHETLLNLKRIPFVVFELEHSLLKTAADYQIALLNMESSDIAFCLKANYPFYYEFFDPKAEPVHAKGVDGPKADGTASSTVSQDSSIKLGTTDGRRFPKDTNNPGFINPDPETLVVSMQKGDKMKEDIRLLVNLNLANMNPRRQAEGSKKMDNLSLEAGLSYIGLVLERGEREIGEHWAAFEGQTPPKITYPRTYNLKTEEERQEGAESLQKLMHTIPSDTYRRHLAKRIVVLTAGAELSESDLKKIEKEIEESDTLTADPDVILKSQLQGLVSDETASNALGYDGSKEVPQAQKDRAEKIALTMEAQGGEGGESRGTPEIDTGKKTSSEEKVGKPGRGESNDVNIGEK